MSTLKNLALAAGMVVATTVAAAAAPLAAGSSIGFGGTTYDAQTAGGVSTTLDLATQIDFSPAGAGGLTNLSSATGSLSGFFGALPVSATISDFSFASFPVGGIINFLTAPSAGPTFALDLNTMTVNSQSFAEIVVGGTATLRADGFDPTPGTFRLSFQDAGGGGVSNYTFTFSGNSAAIPEPATLGLLGAGLLGLGAAMRRRKTV